MFDITKVIITPEILKLIAEIDQFKGAWQLLGRLTPERLQLLRKVATIESIGSSTRIEGSQLSDRDVEKILSNLKAYSFISRDEQEVAGYAFVCQEVFQSYESMEFSENVMKQLHAWLLKYSSKDERHRGEYKKLSNSVEAFDADGKSLGVVFKTSSPFETPFKMQELVSWTRQQLQEQTLHPLMIIGIFNVVFLAIHPFQDGNGRLSRILTTLLLLKSGYAYVPYSSLESIIERSKDNYYLALRRTQTTLDSDNPDFSYWLLFFVRALEKQKTHLEIKVDREKIALLHMPALSAQILTLLHEYGRLTMREFVAMTGSNRNALKKYISDLVASKNIVQLGQGKATWYTLP
ncbi:MAG: Fic family protein [Candidatus Chromulinivorax sp.]|nr:Fic family protein [Candidatus Chromulinivorax sp.]